MVPDQQGDSARDDNMLLTKSLVVSFLGNLLKHVHHLKITILWSHPNSCVGSHPHLTIVTLFNTHRTCYIVFYCHVEYFTCILLSSNEFTFFYLSPFYNHFPLLWRNVILSLLSFVSHTILERFLINFSFLLLFCVTMKKIYFSFNSPYLFHFYFIRHWRYLFFPDVIHIASKKYRHVPSSESTSHLESHHNFHSPLQNITHHAPFHSKKQLSWSATSGETSNP